MAALPFPCTIFQTRKRMDDYFAEDMRYGDLTAAQLKTHYRLRDVSTRVNPYTLTRSTSFGDRKITRQECANILFDEFRYLSRPFALFGPYKYLIEQMISHMQKCYGSPFTSMYLNSALKEHILNDRTENSTFSKIQNALIENINWTTGIYPENKKDDLRAAVMKGKLPKFDRFQDNFNGMGITVHDIWATHITIKSLHIANDRYRAVVHYKVQDHFGLDNGDISKFKFKQFRFFRLWFVLQRYNQFGFRPFMTNMEATVEITGGRNERKK